MPWMRGGVAGDEGAQVGIADPVEQARAEYAGSKAALAGDHEVRNARRERPVCRMKSTTSRWAVSCVWPCRSRRASISFWPRRIRRWPERSSGGDGLRRTGLGTLSCSHRLRRRAETYGRLGGGFWLFVRRRGPAQGERCGATRDHSLRSSGVRRRLMDFE